MAAARRGSVFPGQPARRPLPEDPLAHIRPITVIGCGVAGLTAALRLAEAGRRVRIVARERSPNTTSDIAAAVWYPFRTEASDRALAWALESLAWMRGLARERPEAGVTIVEGLLLAARAEPEAPPWAQAVEGFGPAPTTALPPGFPAGFVCRVPVVQMPLHLAWLAARFEALGGTIETGLTVDAEGLADLLVGGGIVVNCSGLGARELLGDETLFPIRGQVLRVEPGHAPRFVQGPPEGPVTYIVPRPDCTVLGGTTDPGAWDRRVDARVAEAILDRCRALEPGLKDAQLLSHAVGLRPGRPTVRLEAEAHGGGWLLHDYGHGGAGVTLAWACAGAVCDLATGLD